MTTTTTTTTTTMREGDETARRGDGARDGDGVPKRDAANEAPARRKKRRKVVRDVREKVSAAAVLGDRRKFGYRCHRARVEGARGEGDVGAMARRERRVAGRL